MSLTNFPLSSTGRNCQETECHMCPSHSFLIPGGKGVVYLHGPQTALTKEDSQWSSGGSMIVTVFIYHLSAISLFFHHHLLIDLMFIIHLGKTCGHETFRTAVLNYL